MSVNDVANQIQETAEAAVKVTGLSPVANWCSTGGTVLDLALSDNYPGGIPIGRIVQVYGGASTGKSVLATTVLGYALRSGMDAFYADIEHTLDPVFALKYGLDCTHENFHYGYGWKDSSKGTDQPDTLEDFFDEWVGGILKLRTRRPKVLVVDSLTALAAKIETEKGMDKQGFGAYRAKQISLGLRKYLQLLNKKNCTLFVVDQTRDDVGSLYAGEVTTGGRGMEFYSSCRLHLKNGKRVVNSAGKEIGVWVNFNVSKNKTAPPHRTGKFKIMYDYGMDNIVSNLSLLAEIQTSADSSYNLTTDVTIGQCSACGCLLPEGIQECYVEGCGGKRNEKDTKKQVQHWLKLIENENREAELEKVVVAVWNTVHATPERKPRQW